MGATASSVALMSLSPQTALAGSKKARDDFVKLDALAQAELIRKKEVSPMELVEAAIARIEKINPEINAIIHKSFDMALENAKNFTGGDGVFSGVPYVFKGLSQYKGLPATKSSRFMAENIAKTQTAYEDALDNSGAILMGISNTPEFGLLPTTESTLYGAAKNPWNLTRSTAGSSGGTGAAVAAGLVPIGTASDGGGSIRMPATHCGLLGLKPSRGRGIGNDGKFLANRGCISRSVRDTAAYMAITETPRPVGMPKIGMVSTPLKKRLKVAMTTKGHFNNDPHPHVADATRATAKLMESLGHEVVEKRFDVNGDEFMHHFLTLWSLGAYHMTVLARKKFGKEPDESLFEPWTLGLARMHKEERDYMSVEAAYGYFRVVRHQYMSLYMKSIYKEVTPVKPVAPYQGGKIRLAKRIIHMIDQIDHATYAEVFVGMGGIFFRRDKAPKAEIINDYSRDVANLFRILNNHYAAFIDMFRYQLTGRNEFARLLAQNPDSLTDLQRAARFLYLQRTTFGGKVSGQTYGASVDRPARFNISKLEPMLQDVHERLTNVVIECLDWKIFIEKYDRSGTLFYLDPPYFNCEDDYGTGMFSQDQFELMAKILKGIKGKFILSINDVPEIRQLFAGFELREADLHYSLAGKHSTGTRAKELIITNMQVQGYNDRR